MAIMHHASSDLDLELDRCRSMGSSNLLLTFPKIWETFVDIKWQKELYDGKEVEKYRLVAKVAPCLLLVVGCWLLVVAWWLFVGWWLLVGGCWLVVVGCWLLVVVCGLSVVGWRVPVVSYWLWVFGCGFLVLGF